MILFYKRAACVLLPKISLFTVVAATAAAEHILLKHACPSTNQNASQIQHRSWWVCTTHNNVPGFLKIIPVTSYRNNNRGSAIFLHAFQLCVLFIVLFRWIENGWPSPKFVIHMIHSRCMVEITTRDKINSSNRILANGMLFTLDYSWLEYSEHSNDFMLNLGRNWQRSTQNRSSH